MNNLPRQKLVDILRRHGHEIIRVPRRCVGLMRDNFPAYRREIAVLAAALELRMAAELLAQGSSHTPRGNLLARLAARLRDEMAMEESAAHWAIHTWALALSVITQEELDALEQSGAPRVEQDASAPPQVSPPVQPPRATRNLHADATTSSVAAVTTH
ncbi:MAG TPA: hypothetical protein VGB61_10920, partial [Pyrinomonadaceae bacterium]